MYLCKHGINDSFMVFVVSLVALPAIWLWDTIIGPHFPPDRIVPAQGSILTLGLR